MRTLNLLLLSLMVGFFSLAALSVQAAKGEKKPKVLRKTAGTEPATENYKVPAWCIGEAWPLNRNLTAKLLEQELPQFDRNSLMRIAWNEIANPREDSMLVPILDYMARSEKGKLRKEYLETIGFLALGGNMDLETAMKSWPKRHKVTKQSLATLCQWFEKFEK